MHHYMLTNKNTRHEFNGEIIETTIARVFVGIM